MAYVPVGWTEEIAITHTLMNQMESQYDEFTTDFNAHDHDDRYYTKAAADARFFNSGNDGAGSGLDADTVDGFSAEAILSATVPRGAIGYWSGSYESIPAGWVACNGFSSTPDLRNRMIVGAGGAYNRGDMGGYATRTPTGTIAVAAHAITVDEMPSHRHDITDYYNTGSLNRFWDDSIGANFHGPLYNSFTARSTSTETVGSGTAHGHSGSTILFDEYNNMPPYYALWAIMRELES